MICDQWDLVVVPFLFSERAGERRRPALVLSLRDFNRSGHTVMAMITTQTHHPWPADCPIQDLDSAGLSSPCIVRLKVFTLDNRLILRPCGALASQDRASVQKALTLHFLGARKRSEQ